MSVIPNHVHHAGDIKSYLLKTHEVTPLLKSLINQLKSITTGVDPDEGYTNSILNLANRMQMNEAVLLKQLGVSLKEHPAAPNLLKAASMSIGTFHSMDMPPMQANYRDFL